MDWKVSSMIKFSTLTFQVYLRKCASKKSKKWVKCRLNAEIYAIKYSTRKTMKA